MGQFSVEKPVAPGSVLSGNQQSDDKWQQPDPFFAAQTAAKLFPKFPLEAWMPSNTFRPSLELLFSDLVKWTAESIMPSWRTKKGSDRKRTDLFEWNRTLGDLLARVSPFVSVDVARNQFIEPFLVHDEEALSVLARFADIAVRRHIFDAAAIPGNTIPLLDDCVSRVLQDSSFKPKSWHAGEVHGYPMPELIDALLFVNAENVPAAARYANGDWSRIDIVLPILMQLFKRATDKSSFTGIVRVGETKLVDISEHGI
jgi:hypothetical protein